MISVNRLINGLNYFCLSFVLVCNCFAQWEKIKIVQAFPKLSFTMPVDLGVFPGSANSMYVVEKPGRVKIFVAEETVAQSSVFLDINVRVLSRGNEQGLLGLAFSPNYLKDGYFYVYYTADKPSRSVVSRFSVQKGNPQLADAQSEQVILEVPQPYSNHNGGQIVFGPDGYLYIGLGDGGSAGDPHNHGQNLKTLLGSLLRIDPSKPATEKKYSIPSDNPFVGQVGKRAEIYAYGLRNPWRFSFDSVTGQLWLADVGQDRIEEIDIIEKGKNYGWNITEGSLCFKPADNCDKSSVTMPVYEYGRSRGQSVTGGFVYRGNKIPILKGYYIYADYMSGRVWALRLRENQSPENRELLDGGLNVSSFGVDREQELYLCSFDGKIYTLSLFPRD